MSQTVVVDGEIKLKTIIDGEISTSTIMDGDINAFILADSFAYECGEFIPDVNVHRWHQQFRTGHQTAPYCLFVIDVSESAAAENIYYFQYINFENAFGVDIPRSDSETDFNMMSTQAFEYYGITSAVSMLFQDNAAYYLNGEGFEIVAETDHAHWLAGHRYKWTAVWRQSND